MFLQWSTCDILIRGIMLSTISVISLYNLGFNAIFVNCNQWRCVFEEQEILRVPPPFTQPHSSTSPATFLVHL